MLKVIGATGHRPESLGGYSKEITNKLIKVAKEYLENIEVNEVYAGAAIGWDTSFELAALSLNIPINLSIPFKGQETRWPSFDKQIYYTILKRAKSVTYVDELKDSKYTLPNLKPGEYSAVKMQFRNMHIVDNCTTLLAMWNGETKGGTFNCIKYAESQGKEIINLWDKFKNE